MMDDAITISEKKKFCWLETYLYFSTIKKQKIIKQKSAAKQRKSDLRLTFEYISNKEIH